MPFNDVTKDGFSPGRTTQITFDYPDYSLVQDPWWKSLRDLEITGNASRAFTVDVHYLPGIGFQAETIHDQNQLVHEENAAFAQFQDVSTGLAVFQSAPLKAIPSLTGVPVGPQVAGDNFNQKQVAAGDDWSAGLYNLPGDLASYPKPGGDLEIVPLDRVYAGTIPMTPDQTIWLRFKVPGVGGGDSKGCIARLYFTGLASSPNDAAQGTGQYALTLRADGKAFLWELSMARVWVFRKTFLWSPPHQVSGQWHMIAVRSDAYLDGAGKWQGSVINFQCQAAQEAALTLLLAASGLSMGGNTSQYVVPQTKPQNITQVPPRLDVRRDIRLVFSLSFTKFVTDGVLQTQTFSNPRAMGAVGGIDPVITIQATGSFPAGTSLGIGLYGADGTPCAVNAMGPAGSTTEQTWKSFNRIAGQQQYYALLVFNVSADQLKSPIVRRLDVIRQGAVALGASTPWTVPANAATDYSILGPSMDPTLETASLGLISLQDGFTVAVQGVADPLASLTQRSGQSARFEIVGLPPTLVNGHNVTTSTIFLGKESKLRRRRIGVKRWNPLNQSGATAAPYPSRTWWQGKMILNGLWKRLLQAKTTQTWNFGDKDPATGQLYRVTKIISTLLSNAGLPSQMLDIPDLPITLQADPSDKNNAYQVEVYSEAFGWVLQLARDYLGAAVVIDANASNLSAGGLYTDKTGCVRLKLPPRPDSNGNYPPLAKFVDDATWNDGTIRSKLNLNSYAPFVRYDGKSIPVCPILGRTMEDWDEPPEGNVVYVTGTVALQSGGSFQAGSGNAQLWGLIHNWPAAVFYDGQPIACDPTHSDYTDGSPNLIVVVDPSLNTQGAVNFATRRIFDFACHRRVFKRFEAPTVLVVDPLDTNQVRPRPLAWGDCIIYNGQYWFISSVILDVNGERGGTRNGSAIYEMFQIPQLQGISDGKATVYQTTQIYAPIASLAA